MIKSILIGTSAVALAFSSAAIAGPPERKAERICMGEPKEDDLVRWGLITEPCSGNGETCMIERRDGEQASFVCPMDEDEGSGSSGDGDGGGGSNPPRPPHQQ